jgi:hypothetical protein
MLSTVPAEAFLHNEFRNIIAESLSEVCHNVCAEPSLQPLDSEHFKYKKHRGWSQA